ncbi:MAG: hypothetical protein SGI74_03520 [Oligoflexia bacterium]|nr:hypothetical protein [Oligoflexia bacterium]
MIRQLSLFTIALFSTTQALAAPQFGTAEDVMIKSQLEQRISERVREAISTVIERNTFEVDVSVQVQKTIQKSTNKDFILKPSTNLQTLPNDMLMGVIDAEPIVRYYTEQYDRLRDYTESTSGDRFDIKSVNISVGVSEIFGAEYPNELDRWLSLWSKANFGNNTKSDIRVIKAKPNTPPFKSMLDIASSLQHFLGLAFLGICILLGFIAWRIFSRRQQESSASGASAFSKAMLPQPELANQVSKSEKQRPNVEDESLQTMSELKAMRDLMTKIAGLALELKTQQRQMAELWLASGKRGLFKLACFFETLMDATDSQFSFEALPLNYHLKRMLLDVYQQMATLPNRDKIIVFREVYWDLVAAKTLGMEVIKQPFGYLDNLSDDRIKELVASQPQEVQALVAMNMPLGVREKYFRTLDITQKKALINQSLNLREFDFHELEVVNETLRTFSDKSQGSSMKISAAPLARKLLESLTITEEIEVLQDIAGSLHDKGQQLKETYPSLAFLKEWPRESLSLFFAGVESDQLMTLIHVMPTAQELILESCPPRIAQMIAEDLGRPVGANAKKEEHLLALRDRMIILINEGQLNLADIFKSSEKSGLKLVA